MPSLQEAGILSVGGHASPGVGSVNTWWIEMESAVVLFDAQRQETEAAKVAEAVKALGKPVPAILLTHAHPDHIGGLKVLHEAFPIAQIAAVRRTAEVLRTDEGGFQALTRSYLGDDFATAMPEVTAMLTGSGAAAFAGLDINVRDFGLGETVSATVFDIPRAGIAIVGDVVANAMTPWLIEGHTAAWLDQLNKVAAFLQPGTVAYPGHGVEAEITTLIAAQRDYLESFRKRVADAATGGALTPEAKRAVIAETERRHPGWVPVAGIPDLIGSNAEAVARELGIAVTAQS